MNYKEIAELSKHQNIRAINEIAQADAKKRDFRVFKFSGSLLMICYYDMNMKINGYDIYSNLSRSEIKALRLYIRAYKMYKKMQTKVNDDEK